VVTDRGDLNELIVLIVTGGLKNEKMRAMWIDNKKTKHG
jgi:hypothetical protein